MNKQLKQNKKLNDKGFAVYESLFFIPVFLILTLIAVEFSFYLWTAQNTETLMRETANAIHRTCADSENDEVDACLQNTADTVLTTQFQVSLPNLEDNVTLIIRQYRWDAEISQMLMVGSYTAGLGGQTSRQDNPDFSYSEGNLGETLTTLTTIEVFYNYHSFTPVSDTFENLFGKTFSFPEVIYAASIV